MKDHSANLKVMAKLMMRLLPIQILLAAVGSVNGIVSSFFASNYIGVDAMSAVGLYGPVGMLVTSLATMLAGGSVILCGKYMGQNQQDKLQNVFSLNLLLSGIISAIFIAVYLLLGIFHLTGFLTQDAAVRPIFDRYLLGQAVGLLPTVLGAQIPAFLSLENKGKRTMIASVVYIIVNVILNYWFIKVLDMGPFGLALATSLGMWTFLAVEIEPFVSGRTHVKLAARHLRWNESAAIVRIGFPGAASNVYQTARGLIVNHLIEVFVGSVGISAFAASDNLMRIFWAIPGGMLAVSRLMLSVSIGEEDRQSLTDVMRVVFRRYIPLMCAVCAGIILCAVPMTRIFFRDPAEPVYCMTVQGLRILPLCMPLSILCMHASCYAQASGKQALVHALSLLDGVVCVAGFTALLIGRMGMKSVYVANVLNGVVCVLVIYGYACFKKRRLPRTMDDYMVVPDDFGAPEDARIDLTLRSMEEVVSVSRQVQDFCRSRGVDDRRAYLAGLAMEEMAGNVIDHGFTKDRKSHAVDVRVVHKDSDVILRLKDDCVPFDPGERQKLAENADPTKNIGIRMVFRIARDVQYQNILGLNVLTIRL
ncbi:MAG: ATP-binding protein [Oscillospiraceae bacterium]|nr:ATP-binding protein [Oscillospiraceae bacterium]